MNALRAPCSSAVVTLVVVVVVVVGGAAACGRLGYDPARVEVGSKDAAPDSSYGPPPSDARPDGDAPGEGTTSDARTSEGPDGAPQRGEVADAGLASDAGGAPPADSAPASEGGAPDGAMDAGCPLPAGEDRLAEWHADGDDQNLVMCSPWLAMRLGNVPFGAGRSGRAWQFRSTQASEDGDPDYIAVPGARGTALSSFTFDAWVAQTGFNAYVGSNRAIIGTNWSDAFGPTPQAMLYLHENGEHYFYVHVSAGAVRGMDWETCHFPMTAGLGSWVRLTGTYDGTFLRCYRDGALVTSSPLLASQPIAVEELVLGRNYPGDIDALRVLRRALGAADVAAAWP